MYCKKKNCQQYEFLAVIIGAKSTKTFMSYALWVSHEEPMRQLLFVLQVL